MVITGQVVGGWRRNLTKDEVAMELNSITNLTSAEQRALAAAVERYRVFLELPKVRFEIVRA